MRTGSIRLGQLARLIPAASKKALVANLRYLEINGAVVRRDLSSKVRHVEYDFSDAMRPVMTSVLDHLADVGEFYAALAGENKIINPREPARRPEKKVQREG
jgi:DNA-binding HxlR family transcriptional regulator